MRTVLALFEGAGVTLRLSKSRFFHTEVDHLPPCDQAGRDGDRTRHDQGYPGGYDTTSCPRSPIVPGAMKRVPPIR